MFVCKIRNIMMNGCRSSAYDHLKLSRGQRGDEETDQGRTRVHTTISKLMKTASRLPQAVVYFSDCLYLYFVLAVEGKSYVNKIVTSVQFIRCLIAVQEFELFFYSETTISARLSEILRAIRLSLRVCGRLFCGFVLPATTLSCILYAYSCF